MLAESFKIYKKERIKKRNDINSLFLNNSEVGFLSSMYFYIRLKKNNFHYSRFFVGIKKGQYSAVERNSLKRMVRELYRNNKVIIPKGFDYFILVKCSPDTAFVNYKKDFINLFQRVKK